MSFTFIDKLLVGNSTPESVIGFTGGAIIIGLCVMLLFSNLSVSPGSLARKKDANRSLAVSSIVLNAIHVCLAGGGIGLGPAFIH